MTFKKGQSGNINGRPKGTSQADKLRTAIADDLPDIITVMAKAAKCGDTSAAKLLLDRACPTIKPIAQAATVGDLRGLGLSEQGAAIVNAMGNGSLSAEQARHMLAGLASLSKIREVDDLITRIEHLEAKQNEN